MVRAKFKVTKSEPASGGSGFTITMYPVVSGSKENDEFYKWTPGGQLLLSTVNIAVADQLIEGQEYYIDISKAE
jgi:hypothetical protein